VSNAVKSVAAKGGGGTVWLDARVEGDQVRVEVRDDGLGFEPAESRRLFGKFYRPGDELRRRTQGSGLGLSIVARFVQAGGGRVSAASEGPGRGATFRVWWPRARREESA
jgi:signal transduction histidine kinase